ncbi:cytochrome P450 [Ganoderma sinense ZZ0214-1]|uniref:Cytochrome P450 n=1 Tax=Ganoderma sinense ZZ0214-1 TaxID=1077348 RepID=A0A2G8S906_9APHY|nr:cytochrome P450 [Ganoderma sinense ZZ0214-1]
MHTYGQLAAGDSLISYAGRRWAAMDSHTYTLNPYCGRVVPPRSVLHRRLPHAWRLQRGAGRGYPESAFKIATFDRWLIVVSGRRMVQELRKRPVDELSGPLGFQENFQIKYVLEPAVLSDRYHGEVAKEKLLKKVSTLLPNIIDEVFVAVDDNVPIGGGEWNSVHITSLMSKILARASNRAFVGLPLGRNEEFLKLAVGFAMHFAKGAGVLRLVPNFMKSFLAPFVSNGKDDISRAVPYLRPIIEERTRAAAKLGEAWSDKPNDFLQSLLDRAIPKGESVSLVTQRLFMFNFAAIGTSSSAKNPGLAASLREEAHTCISANGWTGAALGSMWKLDSVLRETLRYYGVGLVSMTRKVLKDVTLHDGTRLPAGTLVSANAYSMHHDGALLEDAGKFDPLRYARMRSVEGQGLKHQFAVTSPDYIPFGHGPRACPGRFLASYTLKAVLAYILLRYDLKLAGDGARPQSAYVSLAVVPARDGRVLFKKREVLVRLGMGSELSDGVE